MATTKYKVGDHENACAFVVTGPGEGGDEDTVAMVYYDFGVDKSTIRKLTTDLVTELNKIKNPGLVGTRKARRRRQTT